MGGRPCRQREEGGECSGKATERGGRAGARLGREELDGKGRPLPQRGSRPAGRWQRLGASAECRACCRQAPARRPARGWLAGCAPDKSRKVRAVQCARKESSVTLEVPSRRLRSEPAAPATSWRRSCAPRGWAQFADCRLRVSKEGSVALRRQHTPGCFARIVHFVPAPRGRAPSHMKLRLSLPLPGGAPPITPMGSSSAPLKPSTLPHPAPPSRAENAATPSSPSSSGSSSGSGSAPEVQPQRLAVLPHYVQAAVDHAQRAQRGQQRRRVAAGQREVQRSERGEVLQLPHAGIPHLRAPQLQPAQP